MYTMESGDRVSWRAVDGYWGDLLLRGVLLLLGRSIVSGGVLLLLRGLMLLGDQLLLG